MEQLKLRRMFVIGLGEIGKKICEQTIQLLAPNVPAINSNSSWMRFLVVEARQASQVNDNTDTGAGGRGVVEIFSRELSAPVIEQYKRAKPIETQHDWFDPSVFQSMENNNAQNQRYSPMAGNLFFNLYGTTLLQRCEELLASLRQQTDDALGPIAVDLDTIMVYVVGAASDGLCSAVAPALAQHLRAGTGSNTSEIEINGIFALPSSTENDPDLLLDVSATLQEWQHYTTKAATPAYDRILLYQMNKDDEVEPPANYLTSAGYWGGEAAQNRRAEIEKQMQERQSADIFTLFACSSLPDSFRIPEEEIKAKLMWNALNILIGKNEAQEPKPKARQAIELALTNLRESCSLTDLASFLPDNVSFEQAKKCWDKLLNTPPERAVGPNTLLDDTRNLLSQIQKQLQLTKLIEDKQEAKAQAEILKNKAVMEKAKLLEVTIKLVAREMISDMLTSKGIKSLPELLGHLKNRGFILEMIQERQEDQDKKCRQIHDKIKRIYEGLSRFEKEEPQPSAFSHFTREGRENHRAKHMQWQDRAKANRLKLKQEIDTFLLEGIYLICLNCIVKNLKIQEYIFGKIENTLSDIILYIKKWDTLAIEKQNEVHRDVMTIGRGAHDVSKYIPEGTMLDALRNRIAAPIKAALEHPTVLNTVNQLPNDFTVSYSDAAHIAGNQARRLSEGSADTVSTNKIQELAVGLQQKWTMLEQHIHYPDQFLTNQCALLMIYPTRTEDDSSALRRFPNSLPHVHKDIFSRQLVMIHEAVGISGMPLARRYWELAQKYVPDSDNGRDILLRFRHTRRDIVWQRWGDTATNHQEAQRIWPIMLQENMAFRGILVRSTDTTLLLWFPADEHISGAPWQCEQLPKDEAEAVSMLVQPQYRSLFSALRREFQRNGFINTSREDLGLPERFA